MYIIDIVQVYNYKSPSNVTYEIYNMPLHKFEVCFFKPLE